MQHIGEYDDYISCIPNNMEKYISFSLGKLVFIDSFQFMNKSLGELVKNLKDSGNTFKHCREYFADYTDILTRKGVYPYEYMDSFNKFDDKSLPPIECFYSSLNDEGISEEDYLFAKQVWDKLKIRHLGDYHDLYLVTDVLLLSDVFEEFRSVCLNYYKLDPAHYYTSPGFAWDALLKKSKINLELLSDVDIILWLKKEHVEELRV